RPGTRTLQADEHGCTERFSSRSAFSDLSFQLDWTPGTRDARGQTMGGTETMYLMAFEGQLYAATGYRNDDGTGNADEGPSVLVKPTADSPWLVDRTWPQATYERIESMAALPFNVQLTPNVLPTVIPRLVVALSARQRLSIWIKGPSNYDESIIDPESSTELRAVRAMTLYGDSVTKTEHIFVGTTDGELYRGTFMPGTGNLFQWQRETITARTAGAGPAIMAFAAADDALYATLAPTSTEPGGLYRRTDGTEPIWQLIGPINAASSGSANLRGLTAASSRSMPFTDLLLASTEADGLVRIFSIFPSASERVIDVPSYLQSAITDRTVVGGRRNAYDRFTVAYDPATGEQIHLISSGTAPGLGDDLSDAFTAAPNNGAYFFILRESGALEHSYAYDYANPVENGRSLRAVRTIAVSPFPEDEGRVLYIGGYDAFDGSEAPERLKHNTAWIYRGGP
ncbi:MAG: hypothetical protein AAF449_22460, partial [Myxococcota bacterium]